MEKNETLSLLFNWTTELNESILKSKSQCLALFSENGELLMSNDTFSSLLKNKPKDSFFHPSLESLFKMESTSSLVFEGFITIGDFKSLNTSIHAQVYRKQDNLLILGGIETQKLITQNIELADLNRENVNLQRELVKKSSFLNNTLIELDESNKELTKEKATRDKLFSVIAHDLRSPFGVILGFTDLIKNKVSKLRNNETVLQYLDHIKISAQNAQILLDNLLNWTTVQTGKIRYKPEKINLSTLIQEIIESINAAFEIKKIDLLFQPKVDAEVVVDSNMLQVILRNLISNALKFTKENGSVIISTNLIEHGIEVSVSDTGVGIKADLVRTLFSNEHNETNLGTANEKGSGLGLILCKDFVEKLGGTIWVESKEGLGSNFKFTLPLS
jgi:signal transduction histidine kinase